MVIEKSVKGLITIGAVVAGETILVCKLGTELIKQHNRAVVAEKQCILLEGLLDISSVVIKNRERKINELEKE